MMASGRCTLFANYKQFKEWEIAETRPKPILIEEFLHDRSVNTKLAARFGQRIGRWRYFWHPKSQWSKKIASVFGYQSTFYFA